MDTGVVIGMIGVAAIIKMTIEEAKATIMTEVVTEIDKEGMIIENIGDIMTTAVEATTTTMIGGVGAEEEITIEGIDNTTTEDMEGEAVVDTEEVDMEIEEDEINREAMQTLV